MKLSTAFNYRLKTQMKSISLFLGTFTLISLIFPVLALVRGLSYTVSTTDPIFPTFFFLLGMGLVTVNIDFKLCVQNGMSRSHIFMSYLLSTVSVAGIVAASLSFLQFIIPIIFAGQITFNLNLTHMYTPNNQFFGFLLLLFIFTFAGCIGLLIGIFYNRFDRLVRYITLGLVITSPNLIGITLYYGGSHFRSATLSTFKLIMGIGKNTFYPAPLMLTLLILTSGLIILSFFMNNKCEIRRINA